MLYQLQTADSAVCRRGSEKREKAGQKQIAIHSFNFPSPTGMLYHVAIRALTLSPKDNSLSPRGIRSRVKGWDGVILIMTAHESRVMARQARAGGKREKGIAEGSTDAPKVKYITRSQPCCPRLLSICPYFIPPIGPPISSFNSLSHFPQPLHQDAKIHSLTHLMSINRIQGIA